MKEIFLDFHNYKTDGTVFKRSASRGIIIRDGKVLCIYSKYGDYKFPGGGVKDGESLEQALFREVKEETGYCVKQGSLKKAFVATERRKGFPADLLIMESHYFFCDVEEKCGKQFLDDYEKEYDYKVLWWPLLEIIAGNEACTNLEKVPWLTRENMIFKELKNIVTSCDSCSEIIK